MRKGFLILPVLVCLSIFSVNAQSLLPSSVEQFLFERAMFDGMNASKSSDYDQYSQFFPARMIDGQEMVDAFIAIRDYSVLDNLQLAGVLVNSLFDGFVTARIPVDKLVEVSRMQGVQDVEISRRVQLCTDSTLSVTNVNQVLDGINYNLPKRFDGTGVIVGIIDEGFDFQHRAFRRNDDTTKTRIVRIYDTDLTTGHPVRYNKTVRLPGSVFMDDEIYSFTTDKMNGTHGTHTTSIAAGSHVNGFGGMAPGADIVMCAVGDMSGSLSVVEIANCVRYIDAYADSVGKPCVMSLSVSTAAGQHDGKDYLSKAISQIVGAGRIFVIAAGNNGTMPFYAHKLASRQDPLNLRFTAHTSNAADSTYFYKGYQADIWVRDPRYNFYYKFHVLDHLTHRIVWESDSLTGGITFDLSLIEDYFVINTANSSSGFIKTFTKTSSDGTKYSLNVNLNNLVCKSYSVVNGKKISRYGLGMSIAPRKDVSANIDAWVTMTTTGFGSYNMPVTTLEGDVIENFYSPPSDSCTIGTYAVADSIISAGAFVGRNKYYSYVNNNTVYDRTVTVGDIYKLSSYCGEGVGPIGKALPTICAPGVTVVAAGSRYSYLNSGSQTVMKTDDGSPWGVMTGTSMASPTVAGIIALWLQANPNLSVSDVKSILAESAIKDNFTQGPKSAHFGPNGKIDALAGMRLVLERLGYVLGDVNGDGILSIADLTGLIDHILGLSYPIYFDERAADINLDGNIAIDDVTALIDLLFRTA